MVVHALKCTHSNTGLMGMLHGSKQAARTCRVRTRFHVGNTLSAPCMHPSVWPSRQISLRAGGAILSNPASGKATPLSYAPPYGFDSVNRDITHDCSAYRVPPKPKRASVTSSNDKSIFHQKNWQWVIVLSPLHAVFMRFMLFLYPLRLAFTHCSLIRVTT